MANRDNISDLVGISLDQGFKLMSALPLDVRSISNSALRGKLKDHKAVYSGLLTYDASEDSFYYYKDNTSGWIELKTGGEDGVYLPLVGTGDSTNTTDPKNVMTGMVWFKNCDGIKIQSNNTNCKIWEVVGNDTSYARQYGFYELYKGTGSGNDNNLELYTHNITSSHIKVRTIHQDGTTEWNTNISFQGAVAVKPKLFGVQPGMEGGIPKIEMVRKAGAAWGYIDFTTEGANTDYNTKGRLIYDYNKGYICYAGQTADDEIAVKKDLPTMITAEEMESKFNSNIISWPN